jgi:hypothetical protein
MTLRGTVKKGRIVLDAPAPLPDGTAVEIRPVKKKPAKPKKKPKAPPKPRSLADRLRPFIGKAKNLPPDMSINLDHYLYGLPKRQ